ncbi:MAG: hypothetical protein ACP5O2_00710 [Bacteroidales bacterium]
MSRIKILFFAVIIGLQAYGQGWIGLRSAAEAGMASSGTMGQDVWSGFGNPAGLSVKPSLLIGLSTSSRFSMKEFLNKGLAVSAPVPGGVMAFSGSYFGDASYSEQRYNLAFSKKLLNGFWSGITLDYCRLAQGGGYGGAGAFTFSVGMLTRLNEQTYLGTYIFNPLKSKAGGLVEAEIPAIMRLGIGYVFSSELRGIAEVEKISNQKAGVNLGAEYQAFHTLFLRAGVNTYPGSWSLGMGLLWNRLRLDLVTEMHPTLGLCPQAAISYTLKSNPNE